MNDTIYKGGELTEPKMRVLISSTIFIRNIYHSKNLGRYYHKCTKAFMESARYSSEILMELEISQYIFEKYSNQIS